ncbi:hypothetical protein MMC11_005273 [Xylographa trunciseda]|nr:hypothetical protein [Xylographa trunciseda]
MLEHAKRFSVEDKRLEQYRSGELQVNERQLFRDSLWVEPFENPPIGLYTKALHVSGHGSTGSIVQHNSLNPYPYALAGIAKSISSGYSGNLLDDIRLNKADATLMFLVPLLVNLTGIRIIHSSPEVICRFSKLLSFATGLASTPGTYVVLPNLRDWVVELGNQNPIWAATIAPFSDMTQRAPILAES